MLEPYQLGRYSCVERIGEGPQTETLRARLHGVAGVDRQFAIKRLREPWASAPHVRRRFVMAGHALMPLEDPRLVKVLEARDLADGCFVASEYVGGTDLGRLASMGRLSEEGAGWVGA